MLSLSSEIPSPTSFIVFSSTIEPEASPFGLERETLPVDLSEVVTIILPSTT